MHRGQNLWIQLSQLQHKLGNKQKQRSTPTSTRNWFVPIINLNDTDMATDSTDLREIHHEISLIWSKVWEKTSKEMIQPVTQKH